MNNTIKLQTALSLGLLNLFRVFKYRVGVRTGLNPVQKISAQMPAGCFFARENQPQLPALEFDQQFTAFGWKSYSIGQYPNWFYSPLTEAEFTQTEKPWFKIPDFDDNVGDIKGIWEASRFDWVLDFVKKFQAYNDQPSLLKLDAWLNDWATKNRSEE